MEQHEERTATEARGGSTQHVVRYILVASLILVIIAFLLVGIYWG